MTDTVTEHNDTFTRMDESTAEQWQTIVTETIEHQPRVAEQVLAMLRSLADITDGFAVDQLTHSLQTATRAKRPGPTTRWWSPRCATTSASSSPCSTIPRIAAEILRPYVSEDVRTVVETHQDFQGRHYYGYLGQDPESREQHRGAPWFELAERFADEWDQTSFDPDYPTKPLEHFEPMVRAVFGRTHGG